MAHTWGLFCAASLHTHISLLSSPSHPRGHTFFVSSLRPSIDVCGLGRGFLSYGPQHACLHTGPRQTPSSVHKREFCIERKPAPRWLICHALSARVTGDCVADGRNYTSDSSTCRLKAHSPYARGVISVGTEYPVVSQGAGIHLHSCVALQMLAAFSKVCICAFRGQGPYLPFSSL